LPDNLAVIFFESGIVCQQTGTPLLTKFQKQPHKSAGKENQAIALATPWL
jgi:hypothetical protein